MKHIPLTTLCVAISAVLLTACGGSGGSNPPAPTPIPNAGNAGSGTGGAGSTDNTANAGNTGGTNSGTGSASTPEPKYQDVPTDENKKDKVSSIQEPAMGYGMALSKMNLYKQQDTPLDEKDIITLDGKKQVAKGGKSPLPFSLDVENKLLDGYIAKMDKADKNAIGDRIKRENEQNKKISDEELAKKIKENVRKSPDFQKVLSSIKAKTFHSNDKTTKATTRDLKYVDYGYYLVNDDYLTVKTDKLWNLGPVGGVFYNGSTTAKELPTQDAVKYKGHWDFMTDVAKNKRNRFSEVKETYQAGWYYGASSKDEYDRLLTQEGSAPDGHSGEYGHSSEFTVNFKDKKLTGGLFSNLQDGHKGKVTKTKRYDINASIHGNRFRGSAIASDKNDASKTKHPFTSDAKDRLEGGFYGPKGEELAGKFLTDDNKLFGVFGAKQEGEAKPTEAILDAYALGTFNTNDATTFTPFTKKQLDNFGNAKKLVLGSTVIDLVPTDATKDVNEFTKNKPDSATNKAGETLMVNDKVSVKTYGKNFEYLKFGELSVGTSNSVFLQGERTATTGDKAVPTKGTAKYLGNWVGYITGKDTGTGTGKSFTDAQDIADFDIDFEKKSVKGKLTTQGRQDPVFSITGKIAGNGWTGKASTAEADAGGYKIDSSSTGKSIVIKDAEVTGGFYGPNANEMGGSFTHNADDKVSVVFGAKKQEVK